MKKIISTVAALGLVVGVAGTASALDLTVTGQYVLEGYMMDNADGSGFNPYMEDVGSDSAWVHTFQLRPTLTVNDKIKMIADIRMAKDSDWGNQDDVGRNKATNAAGTTADFDRTIDVHKIYMEYMSPVGKIRAGRTPAGAWAHDFVSSSGNANRLMWWPNMVQSPFSAVVFLQKSTEGDWYGGTTDSDSDLYEAGLSYKVDGLLLNVAYDYINDKTVETQESQRHLLKGYANISMDNIYVESEIAYMFGDWVDYDVETLTDQDADIDAWAFMIDGGMKMGNLDVGAMFFYASGQDDDSDDMEAAMGPLGGSISDGIGDDFNPYYILTGDHTGMLNSDEYADDANMAIAGVLCLGVHSDFQVSDQLTLHGALAYAWADETDALGNDIDDEYGWEIDLGAKYKLLDNLTYEVRAAYMDTGDFFDDLNGTDDEEDLYLLSHHLTMTF
ncbi:MAG: hypothetical protein KQH63_10910 [Desulfobulbaceae bacterium]|nr:hypothetical protein [Desulfobulbaceae bacterium]